MIESIHHDVTMGKSEAEYGFTFEEVKEIRRPTPRETYCGVILEAVVEPEFFLGRIELRKGLGERPSFMQDSPRTLFVEKGRLALFLHRDENEPEQYQLQGGDIVSIPPNTVNALYAVEDSTVYVISRGRSQSRVLNGKAPIKIGDINSSMIGTHLDVSKTSGVKKKYWGEIETIIGGECTAKRISMHAGTQSSLEYHCQKKEAYYLHSGRLKVGIRVGRAENHSVILEEGDVYVINPGLMHMRIALSESVIYEISTSDDDSDSHLVEDGRKYVHIEKRVN